MLLSFIIFALATKQNVANGITNDSFGDICGRSLVPLYCNSAGSTFETCGSSSMLSRSVDADDDKGRAGRILECCASCQAKNLNRTLNVLSNNDPNESARATYGNCASKYHDILYENLAPAYLDLRLPTGEIRRC